MRRLLIGVCALMVSLVMSSPGLAQSGTSGPWPAPCETSFGGALLGVTVTLSRPSLQRRQIVQVSDETGTDQFVDVPVGTFRVSFELAGVSTSIREDLRLTAGFTLASTTR